MPVARIITRSEKDAMPFAEELRNAGYTVEIVEPGSENNTPANLEVTLERVKTEEALERAREYATRLPNAEIYVDPEVFAEKPDTKAAEKIPAIKGSDLTSRQDVLNGVREGVRNKRRLLAKALWQERVLRREARRNALAAAEQQHADVREEEAQPVRAETVAEIAEPSYSGESLVAVSAMTEPSAPAIEPRQIAPSRMAQPRSRRAREWRVAAAISLVASGLLVAGWALGRREAVSPLPATLVSRPGIEQQVPFGAATAKAPISPGVSSRSATGSTTFAKEQPGSESIAAPTFSKPSSLKERQNNAGRKRMANGSVEDDGEEVVVRHFQRERRSPPTAQRVVLKRFSDME